MEKIKNKRFPPMPLRGHVAESFVTRGIFSDLVWPLQMFLTVYAMLNPGTLEIARPLLGDTIFLVIMIA